MMLAYQQVSICFSKEKEKEKILINSPSIRFGLEMAIEFMDLIFLYSCHYSLNNKFRYYLLNLNKIIYIYIYIKW
jgi:hypothetical protein